MINISKGGVGIKYPTSAEMGTKFKIQFSLPTKTDVVPISVSVTVCHIHFKENSFHIGFAFEEMSTSDKLIISSFIQTKLNQKKLSQNVVTANNKY